MIHPNNRTFIADDCWGCHKRVSDAESMKNWAPLFRRDRQGHDVLLGDMVWCDECFPGRPKAHAKHIDERITYVQG